MKTLKTLKHIALLVGMLLMSLVSVGQNILTVCDGTATNNYVPMYTFWCDYGFSSEYIIPQSELNDLPNGCTITSLTLYQYQGVSWIAKNLIIKISNTTQTSYNNTDLIGNNGTIVYSNSSYNSNSSLTHTFQFDVPFIYDGNSIIIQISASRDGTYNTSY